MVLINQGISCDIMYANLLDVFTKLVKVYDALPRKQPQKIQQINNQAMRIYVAYGIT